jgi:histidine decarboxylase
LREVKYQFDNFPSEASIYSLTPLIKATEKIFGTVDKRIFPLRPGAHVPCANKTVKSTQPAIIFSAIAIGIAERREDDACLLMEDVGKFGIERFGDLKSIKLEIIEKLAKSVVAIGENQRAKYKEIFAEVSFQIVNEDEVGCALVAAPYFTLAQNAVSYFNL